MCCVLACDVVGCRLLHRKHQLSPLLSHPRFKPWMSYIQALTVRFERALHLPPTPTAASASASAAASSASAAASAPATSISSSGSTSAFTYSQTNSSSISGGGSAGASVEWVLKVIGDEARALTALYHQQHTATSASASTSKEKEKEKERDAKSSAGDAIPWTEIDTLLAAQTKFTYEEQGTRCCVVVTCGIRSAHL